jgi:hypothetical protein
MAIPEFKHFEVIPASPTLGGTIEGIHLSEICDGMAAELRTALWHYGVTADLGDSVRELHRVAAWSPSVRPALDRDAAIEALMQTGPGQTAKT